MPNIFPKRQLNPQDVLAPNDMNEDLQPIQATVTGNLDMENITGSFALRGSPEDNFKIATIPEPEAYYTLHSAPGRFSNPDFLDGRSLSPTTGPEGVQHPNFDPEDPAPGVFVVPDNNQWVPIDDLDVEFTTGAANLWINAIVQYSRNGWQFGSVSTSVDRERIVNIAKRPSQAGLHHRSNGFFPARLQFAIRINGRVLDWTVTGKNDIHETDSIGIRPVESLAEGAADDEKRLPGITVPNTRIASLGPEMLPIRLGTFFPVEPGKYKVEVVARRIPTRKVENLTEDDVIGLFARELHVLELPVHSTQTEASTTRTALVRQLQPESFLTRVPESVTETIDQCNNLSEGNIRREALFNTQLPSKVVAVRNSTISFPPGNYISFSSHWPGFNSNEVTTETNGWGWYQIKSTSAGPLQVETTETFRDDDIIILMADLGLRALEPRGGAAPIRNYQRFLDMYGAFRFGIRDELTSTGETDWRVTRTSGTGYGYYANSFNWCSFLAGFSNASSTDTTASAEDFFGVQHAEHVNIPLFTVMRGSSFRRPPGTKYYISVFGGSMSVVEGGVGTGPSYGDGASGTTLDNPEIHINGANLIMIHLRK